MKRFDYIDPRGRRSGPYSEEELKSLAARGLLEPDGTIALAAVGEDGRVSSIPWLSGPSGLTPPRSSEEAVALAARADAELQPTLAETSRTGYVLLALLLPFIGLFGVHNLVAGYTGRGIFAVLLSMLTFGGVACALAPPCACVSVPIWLLLFAVSVFEALTVRSDARGRPFR